MKNVKLKFYEEDILQSLRYHAYKPKQGKWIRELGRLILLLLLMTTAVMKYPIDKLESVLFLILVSWLIYYFLKFMVGL